MVTPKLAPLEQEAIKNLNILLVSCGNTLTACTFTDTEIL